MAVDAAPERRSERALGLQLVAAAVAIMWVSEIADQATGLSLDQHGIVPRAAEGLDGIVWSPFLHGGFGHLIGNTIPFLVLGALIALSGAMRVVAVAAIVALVGGAGTWLVAPEETIHIGASGLVFGFASYLIARGAFTRRLLHVAAAVLVAVVYGFTLLRGLLPEEGISWQGHLFGAIGGVIAARILAQRPERESRRTG